MPAPIVGDLADLMVDVLRVERNTGSDGMGARTYDPPANFQCRLVGGHVQVRGTDGKEKVSTVQCTTAGAFGFTTQDRFTLVPSAGTFTPSSPECINVRTVPDENGPHHQKLFF
jgi:hypothetical protein